MSIQASTALGDDCNFTSTRMEDADDIEIVGVDNISRDSKSITNNSYIEESYFDSEDPVNKNRENNWTQIAIEKLYYEIYFD